MKRWIIAALVAAPCVAHAERVAVTVTEVAGDVAYVTPGRSAGIAAGDKITFGDAARVVLEVTDDSASVKLDGLALAVGAAGSVDAAGKAATVAAARTLRAEPFLGEWPEVIVPAQVQQPKAVPLGSGRRPGRVHVAVIGSGYAATSADHGTADGEARLIASWDVLADRPLAADVDVSGRVFSEGYDKHLRSPMFVRAAQLRYGSASDPMVALGRLRFAASSVGMLDGARGAYHLGAFELAAFGGIVPDPISGKPDTSATRFGTEATYDLPTNDWRPRVSVAASGSTWSGKLDERRLAVDASASRGGLSLTGWAEAQAFSSDNPWRARAVELTGAGLTTEWRQHGTHLGLDVDFLRPERSLRLAAALPPSWLCSQASTPGDPPVETCRTGDSWTTATVSVGTRHGRWSVDGYGTVGRSHLVTTTIDTSAYVRGQVDVAAQRYVLGVTVGKAAFGSWDSAEVGIGTLALRPLDLMVRYRAELLDYLASTGPMLLHTIAGDLRYPCSTSVDLALSALGTTGTDRTIVALLATMIWRPLP